MSEVANKFTVASRQKLTGKIFDFFSHSNSLRLLPLASSTINNSLEMMTNCVLMSLICQFKRSFICLLRQKLFLGLIPYDAPSMSIELRFDLHFYFHSFFVVTTFQAGYFTQHKYSSVPLSSRRFARHEPADTSSI